MGDLERIDFSMDHGAPYFANTPAEIDRLCQQVLDDRPTVISYDAEWAYDPSRRYAPPCLGLSTIQFCYTTGSPTTSPQGSDSYNIRWKCMVLHIAMIPGRMTDKLRQVLENKNFLLLTWGDTDQRYLVRFYPGLKVELHDVMTGGWGKLVNSAYVTRLSGRQK